MISLNRDVFEGAVVKEAFQVESIEVPRDVCGDDVSAMPQFELSAFPWGILDDDRPIFQGHAGSKQLDEVATRTMSDHAQIKALLRKAQPGLVLVLGISNDMTQLPYC